MMLNENMQGPFSDGQDCSMFTGRVQGRMLKMFQDSIFKCAFSPNDLPANSAPAWKCAIQKAASAAVVRSKTKGDQIFFDPDLQLAYDNAHQKPVASQSDHSWTSILSVPPEIIEASQSDSSGVVQTEVPNISATKSGNKRVSSQTVSFTPAANNNLATSPGQATQVTVTFPSSTRSPEKATGSSYGSSNISKEFPCAQRKPCESSIASASQQPSLTEMSSVEPSVQASTLPPASSASTYITAVQTPVAKVQYGYKTIERPKRKRPTQHSSPETVPPKKVKQKSVAVQMPSQRIQ